LLQLEPEAAGPRAEREIWTWPSAESGGGAGADAAAAAGLAGSSASSAQGNGRRGWRKCRPPLIRLMRLGAVWLRSARSVQFGAKLGARASLAAPSWRSCCRGQGDTVLQLADGAAHKSVELTVLFARQLIQ